MNSNWLALDLETEKIPDGEFSLAPWRTKVLLCGNYDGEVYRRGITPNREKEISQVRLVGHNLFGFDSKILRVQSLLRMEGMELHCTQLMASILRDKVPQSFMDWYAEERKRLNKELPKGQSHREAGPLSLKVLAPWYLKVPPFWENTATHNDVEYNEKDCRYTYELAVLFERKLKEEGSWDFYMNRLRPWAQMIQDMEVRGIRIDNEEIAKVEQEYLLKRDEKRIKLDSLWQDAHKTYFELQAAGLKHRYADMAQKALLKTKDALKTAARYNKLYLDAVDRLDKQINYASPSQMSWLLKDYLKLDITDPEGEETTGKSVLNRLAQDREDIRTLLEWKEADKVLTMYLPTYRNLQIDGIVHPQFHVTGTRTGRLSSSGPNCISIDTKILTSCGWKRYEEIDELTKVAQYLPESGKIEFVSPLRVIHPHASNDVYHIKNEHIDLVATGDHRQLFVNRKTGKIVERNVNAWLRDAKVLHSGMGVTEDKSDPILMALAIAIQADGTRRKKSWDIRLKRPRKIRRLRKLLELSSVAWSERSNFRGDQVFNIQDNGEFINWISSCDDKLFQRPLNHYSLKRALQFCRELRYWDGLSTRYNSCYTTKEERNALYVLGIYCLTNQRAKKSAYQWLGETYWRFYETRDRNYSGTSNVQITKAPAQQVWCVTVPSSFIIIEHGGCPLITGNCQQIPPKLYRLFKPRDGYKFIQYDLSGIEAALIALYSGDRQLYEIMEKGESMHDHNVRALFGITDDLSVIASKYPRQRKTAKNLGFGTFYGAGWRRIQTVFAQGGFPITEKEAKRKLAMLKEYYPDAFTFHKEITEVFESGEVVHNLFGRPLKIQSHENAYMQGFNTLIQSSASDLNIRAAERAQTKWREEALDTHLLLLIHDCIVAESQSDKVTRASTILVDSMTEFRLESKHGPIKLHVDGGINETWKK